jgi:hypothetical protein
MNNINSSKKKVSSEQREELLRALKARVRAALATKNPDPPERIGV